MKIIIGAPFLCLLAEIQTRFNRVKVTRTFFPDIQKWSIKRLVRQINEKTFDHNLYTKEESERIAKYYKERAPI